MTGNGLGLGEVGEIEAQMFNKPLMLIEVRMFKFSTSAPILPNPCCTLFFFRQWNNSYFFLSNPIFSPIRFEISTTAPCSINIS